MKRTFKILHIHRSTGGVDVEWDGDSNKVITCRIPIDEAGNVLPPAEFKADIMQQCVRSLEFWDRLELVDVATAETYIDQTFDVTEEYILRNVGD